MDTFKTQTFLKWQNKEEIGNIALLFAIEEMHKGLVDADLGNGLVKKRIAQSGSGKSSGHRTVLATNKNNIWIFIYGFAKSDKDNISDLEKQVLKSLVKDLLNLNKDQIKKAVEGKELIRVIYE